MIISGVVNMFFTSAAAVAQLTVEPVFGWWAALPLVAILLASLWLTLTTGGISLRGRLLLSLIRLAAMLVLLLGWMQPGFVTTIERESPGAIGVLMDRSLSMTLPGGRAGDSRWQVQKDVWDAIQSATSLRIGETKIVPYFYDSQVVAADAQDLPRLNKSFQDTPSGKLTDLGHALSEISRLQVEPPLRGVILMGDATQTLLPPAQDATMIARQMAQLDQPILLVGIGQQNDDQLRDVAIEGMPEDFSAFLKKEIRVPMVVSSSGMSNIEIDVTLTLRASGKPERVLDSRKIIPTGSMEKLPIEFSVLVPEAGEYLLEARASPPSGFREQITTNNSSASFVTVREGGVRILYLEGQLRFEQSYLKRSLDESLDFELDFVYVPQKEQQRNQWHERTNRIDFTQYDAIILGDLDSRALSLATQQRLAKQIEQGAGLLALGGFHSLEAGGYANSPIGKLLPIQMRDRRQNWDQQENMQFHIAGDVQLRPNESLRHPVTAFSSDPLENRQLWAVLKPLKQMNRIEGLSRAPGVQVLLESTAGQAAMVAGEAGRGRVLVFAGDTTWRWWTSGQKRLHQQFWRQTLLWLVRRDSLTEGFRLRMDRRRLAVGESPELTIEWLGGTDEKAMPDDLTISVSNDGRWIQNLSSAKVSSTVRKTTVSGLETPGLYQVELTSTAADGKSYQADVALIVRDESLELSNPSADRLMMDNIVSANQLAGGRHILPEQISDAIDWLQERQRATRVASIEKRRLGDAAWDAWTYLVVFSLLMSLEWGLRKSWQLP